MDKWIELGLSVLTTISAGGVIYFYVQLKTIKATQKKADGEAIKAHAEARKVNAEAASIEVDSDIKLIAKYAELYNTMSTKLTTVENKLAEREKEREVEKIENTEWRDRMEDKVDEAKKEAKASEAKYKRTRCDDFTCVKRVPPPAKKI